MKPSALISLLLLTVVTGGLVVTNPSPDAYQDYASQQAEQFFSREVCTELSGNFSELLAGRCEEMLAAVQPQLHSVIRDRTTRINLGVASIYRTSFGIAELTMLPRYEVETLGIVGRFVTYRADRVQ